MKKPVLYLLINITIILSGCSPGDPEISLSINKDNGFSHYVDENGKISRPVNFRDNWTHLGSWFVKNDDMASGPGVHDVYATPKSVKAFKENGQWPDGAVLVKTVSGIKNGLLTTGNALWAGKIDVWFVMIRDQKNRFPDNKAWGEGWGWALFTSDDPDKNLTSNWKGTGFNNCFGCHSPAKNTEWVYIDGYPAIRESAMNSTENTKTH